MPRESRTGEQIMKKETDRMERPNLSGKVIPAHFVRLGAAHQEKRYTAGANRSRECRRQAQ